MPRTLLAAATGAGTSEPMTVAPGETVVFTAPGLAGAETATLERKAADGGFDAVSVTGMATALSTSVTQLVIDAPGVYRINKGVTVGSVPVEVSYRDNL